MAKKKKKITVKYALNDRIKPSFDENGEELYRIYIQIIFNSKSVRFPSYAEEDMKEISKVEFQKNYAKREFKDHKKIDTIIRKEVSLVGLENYSLNGISERLSSYYGQGFGDVLWDYLTLKFDDLMKDQLTYRQYQAMEKAAPYLELSSLEYHEFSPLLDRIKYAIEEVGIQSHKSIPSEFQESLVICWHYSSFEDSLNESILERTLYKFIEQESKKGLLNKFSGYLDEIADLKIIDKDYSFLSAFSIDKELVRTSIESLVNEIIKFHMMQ